MFIEEWIYQAILRELYEVKTVDIDPVGRPLNLTFGPRNEIKFYKVKSERFEKQELLAYNLPIFKIIEENSIKDILTQDLLYPWDGSKPNV